MRAVADPEIFLVVNAVLLELIQLLDQGAGIQDHAISNHANLPLLEDPRRNQVKNELLVTHLHRVTRVGPALVADDHIEVGRQRVDDLPLAFISPLDANHTEVLSARAHKCSCRKIRAGFIRRECLLSNCR